MICLFTSLVMVYIGLMICWFLSANSFHLYEWNEENYCLTIVSSRIFQFFIFYIYCLLSFSTGICILSNFNHKNNSKNQICSSELIRTPFRNNLLSTWISNALDYINMMFCIGNVNWYIHQLNNSDIRMILIKFFSKQKKKNFKLCSERLLIEYLPWINENSQKIYETFNCNEMLIIK